MFGKMTTSEQPVEDSEVSLPFAGRKRKRNVQSSEDVQVALRRAREKLRGAVQKRELAKQRLSPVHGSVHPISALSANLSLSRISASGPHEKVLFPVSALPVDLGRSSLQSDMGVSNSLAEKKLRLQKELLALKERLEQHPGQHHERNLNADPSQRTSKQHFSKEELEKRKEEAQSVVDMSHWRHFISKQEHMLEEANTRVVESRRALLACENESQQIDEQLRANEGEMNGLENRERVLAELLTSASRRILQMRHTLHSAVDQRNAD